MNDADYSTFERAFRRLSGAFRMKLKPDEMDEVTRTYFRVLDTASLDDVLAAAKTCLTTCKTFPRPVEWIAALEVIAPPSPAGDLRTMFADEAQAYTAAEKAHWQDEPCDCAECQAAGVTHRFLRFVPDFTEDGRDERAFHPGRGHVVTVGHWAHGAELASWYQARDTFFGAAARYPRLARLVPVLVTTDASEPWQEG